MTSSKPEASNPDGSVILRIKRKRGTDPVTALRIETLLSEGLDAQSASRQVEQEEQQQQQRQRTRNHVDEKTPVSPYVLGTSPDDRLEGAAPTKRRLTAQNGRTIFRFAERVSVGSFIDKEAAGKIHQRITKIRRCGGAGEERVGREEKQPVSDVRRQGEHEEKGENASPSKWDADPSAAEDDPSGPRFRVVRKQIQEQRQQGDEKRRGRKALVNALRGKNASSTSLKMKGSSSSLRGSNNVKSNSSRGSMLTPPEVKRANPYTRVRVIDAVAEDSGGRARTSSKTKRKREVQNKELGLSTLHTTQDTEMDALDRRFADLLGDYLKANDLEPPRDLYDAKKKGIDHSESKSSSEDDEEDSSEEYVYDIYYREREPNWGSGSTGASDVGLRPAKVEGRQGLPSLHPHAVPITSTEPTPISVPRDGATIPGSVPMATLVGLTTSDFLFNDDLEEEIEAGSKLVPDEKPGDSDDDFDEGEDEDSNDEGFYRNDYPEQEVQEEGEEDMTAWGWSGPRKSNAHYSSSGEEEDKDEEQYDD